VVGLKELEATAAELRAEMKRAERALAEAKGELELVRRRFAYVVDSPEAQEAIAEAEGQVREAEVRLQELRMAHEKAVKKLEAERKRLRNQEEKQIAAAKKRLPQVARVFHKARCELLAVLAASFEQTMKAISPVLEAAEAYYEAGEEFEKALRAAGELREYGWPQSWRDLTEPAQVLWHRVIREVPIPRFELKEEEDELLDWWTDLLTRTRHLARDFPPVVMTPERRRKCEAEAQRQREELIARLQRQRETVRTAEGR